MVLSDGRTDSSTLLGWISGPSQTVPTECINDKTVIRDAIDTQSEGNAKLGNIKYADEVGDAPYLVPEPSRNRCRATVLCGIGRTGSSSVLGQKRCAPHAEASLSLVRTTRSCLRSRGDFNTEEVLRVVIPLCEGAKSASQTRQTGDRAATRSASNQDEP